MTNFKKGSISKFYLLAFGIIIFDQIIKLIVHFNMEVGDYFTVFGEAEWLKIYYTTNPGMAFGLKFGGKWSKLFLTTFRIIASGGIAYYIYYLWNRKVHRGFIWAMCLIFAGALGNVLDSIFYGIFLEGNVIKDAPFALFHGQVVDMIYVDIWEGYIGKSYYSLWPIFNIADSSIFIGVSLILILQKKFFAKEFDNSVLSAS